METQGEPPPPLHRGALVRKGRGRDRWPGTPGLAAAFELLQSAPQSPLSVGNSDVGPV